MKKFLLKSLLVAAGLLTGGSAWATDVYTIVYGTPTYAGDGITINGVTPQTDFTSGDGSTASIDTNYDGNDDGGLHTCSDAMPIGGSVLITKPNFTKSFASAVTKGIVHFECNFTIPTGNASYDNTQAWQILDSNGVVIYGTTNAGQNNGNGNYSIGYCNGTSIGTAYYRLPRSSHSRVVLDINMTTKKVSYSITTSTNKNTVSVASGTYDLPASVSDVKTLSGQFKSFTSYMDNVSFYNVYDDAVTLYDYTINYKLDDNIVKTFASSDVVDAVVIAETAINGEGTYAGNHYLITAAEAPSMTLDADNKVLNVPVRAPYTATLNVTRTIGGVAQTPVVTNLTETDAKVCSWSYAYPLYVQKDGVYYIADVTSSFGENGTFTNGEVINKTVAYTNPDYSVVYFGEPNESTGTSTTYSNGTTGHITGGVAFSSNDVIRLGTLAAGTYRLITNVVDRPDRNVVVGDCSDTSVFPTALVTISTSGAKDEEFTLVASTPISISGKDQGNNKFNQSATVDYILVKASTRKANISSVSGFATLYSSVGLDFSEVAGLTAYTATVSESTVTLTEVSNVPAYTGVVLKGAAGDYNIPVIASSATDEGDLKGSATDDKAYDTSYDYYYLAMNDSEEAQFKKLNEGGSIAAGKAYLQLPYSAGAPSLKISFTDAETGINEVNAPEAAANGYFNLAGQRVANPTKGLYIVNGKKVLVK